MYCQRNVIITTMTNNNKLLHWIKTMCFFMFSDSDDRWHYLHQDLQASAISTITMMLYVSTRHDSDLRQQSTLEIWPVLANTIMRARILLQWLHEHYVLLYYINYLIFMLVLCCNWHSSSFIIYFYTNAYTLTYVCSTNIIKTIYTFM